MKNNRKKFSTSVAVVATASLLALSACSSDGGGAEADGGGEGFGELTLQLSFIKNAQNAGEYVADDKGYYADEGFESVNMISGPTAVEASVATKKADIGYSTTLGTASVIKEEDMPLTIIGAVYKANAFTVMSMEGENAIRTPDDLKGKRIGVTAGTAEIIMEAFLAANGMEADDITFVPAEGSPALLTEGEVDGYFALATNELLTLELAGEDVVSLPLYENGLPLTGTVFAVDTEELEQNREKYKAFLRAEIAGWADEVNDPALGVDLALNKYGADLGLDEEKEHEQGTTQIDYIYPEDSEDEGLFRLSDEEIAANIEALTNADISLDGDVLYDMSLLDEIYEENPELLKVRDDA